MCILPQNSLTIYNFDNFDTISLKDKVDITLYRHSDGRKVVLGIYSSEERAKEVFKQILAYINGGKPLYQMPKE